MIRNPCFLMLVVLCTCLSSAAAQQIAPNVALKVAPQATATEFSRTVKLFRSLCLQDFEKEAAESVYGMHGQAWIVKKLKIDAETNVFLSTGFSASSIRRWRAPDPDLVQGLGSKRIHSANKAKKGDIVVIIENIDWESQNIVNLDISTYHEDLGMVHGSVDVRLKFEDEKWVIASPGGCHLRRVDKR